MSLVALALGVYPHGVEDPRQIVARVLGTRRQTLRLVEPLSAEDMVVQSMPDASPTKWHLAHTTWFFDRFVLRGLGAPPVRGEYDYLFNSYYDAVGARHPRARRGMLTRPSLEEVLAYRRAIDARLADLEGSPRLAEVASALELGLHHEQQHQELILTDVLHLFAESALAPAYATSPYAPADRGGAERPITWRRHAAGGGVREIGHPGGAAFSFDNERPRHKVYVAPFAVASRLVTEGEYLAFMEDGGYRRPELWLSEGFAWAQGGARSAPLYWRARGGREARDARPPAESASAWVVFGPHGERALDPSAPVTHVTYYEADAYARWAGARLPTEAEWEIDAAAEVLAGRRREGDADAAWQWTQSAYAPYPGFAPLEGAFGEYNGKFMVGQMVLRGGSAFTPADHVRTTYRNFFPPSTAWQLSGIRLARDDA